MKYEQCKKCQCSSCMQNAEDYADGLCRDCEMCREQAYRIITTECEWYTSDNDPSGLI